MIDSISIKKWVFSPKTQGNNPHKQGQMPVVTGIPITPSCKYVNELMTDEYVMLNWNSDVVLSLSVGDFVDQVDGGIYYIRELATPTRNSAGGYTYEQKFEAEWKFWGDTKLFYKRGIGADSGWKMTQFPKYFLDLIIDTINESAWKFGEYTYEIHGEFPEMKLCDFSSGTDIISALNTMCDDEHWRTEWWVDSYNCVLHFGACVSENTVSMDEEYTKSVNRSQSQNSKGINVLYAFGGTRNISNIYRKDLVFKVQEGSYLNDKSEEVHLTLNEIRGRVRSIGYNTAVVDAQRLLPEDCLINGKYIGETKTYNFTSEGETRTSELHQKVHMSFSSRWMQKAIALDNMSRTCRMGGRINMEVAGTSGGTFSGNLTFKLVDENGQLCSNTTNLSIKGSLNTYISFIINTSDILTHAGKTACYLVVEGNLGKGDIDTEIRGLTYTWSDLSVTLLGGGYAFNTRINIHGRTYDAVINPSVSKPEDDWQGRRYVIAYNKDAEDTDASVGDTFTLENIEEYLVPVSFFTRRDDAVKAGVAENRLMLPDGIDYIEDKSVTLYNVREGILVLDDIYPKMEVTVTKVDTIPAQTTDKTTGVVEKWNAYGIHYEGFEFDDKYKLDGEELHIVFQSGQLAGMDFNVVFDPDKFEDKQVLEIVRNNEDYGTPIPNDQIKPGVGDKFILYGWNTDYIDQSLVPQAERQLLQTATEVLEEMQKDQSTYDMEMNVIRCKGYSMRDWKMVKVDEGAMRLKIGQKVEYTNSIYGSDTGDGNKLITARIRRVERGLDDLSLRYQLGVSAPYSRSRELRNLINSIK